MGITGWIFSHILAFDEQFAISNIAIIAEGKFRQSYKSISIRNFLNYYWKIYDEKYLFFFFSNFNIDLNFKSSCFTKWTTFFPRTTNGWPVRQL